MCARPRQVGIGRRHVVGHTERRGPAEFALLQLRRAILPGALVDAAQPAAVQLAKRCGGEPGTGPMSAK